MIEEGPVDGHLFVGAGDGEIIQADELDAQLYQGLCAIDRKGNETRIILRLAEQIGIAGFEQNALFTEQLQARNVIGRDLALRRNVAYARRSHEQLERERVNSNAVR